MEKIMLPVQLSQLREWEHDLPSLGEVIRCLVSNELGENVTISPFKSNEIWRSPLSIGAP